MGYRNGISSLENIRIKKHDKIIIGSLNINSIRNKFDQLKLLLANHIDILILIETKLDESFPTSQFLIEGFCEPYRQDK